MQLLVPCSSQQQQLQQQQQLREHWQQGQGQLPFDYASERLLKWLWGMWAALVRYRPQVLAPIIQRKALPLLQRLQQSLDSALGAASNAAGSSSSSSQAGMLSAAGAAVEVQRCVLQAVNALLDLDKANALPAGCQLAPLISSDELVLTMLQQLVAAAAMLHRHMLYRQQQQGSDGAVPAYHESLLHLLPGGDAYIGAAGAAAATACGVLAAASGDPEHEGGFVDVLLGLISNAAPLMPAVLQGVGCAYAALAAGECVPLAVELQLLLAAEHEHQKQVRADEDMCNQTLVVLASVNRLLLLQLWMVATVQQLQQQQQQQQMSFSRLQQLLQGPEPPLLLALAAPLQHLPSDTCPASLPGQQLFALQAAFHAARCNTNPGEHLQTRCLHLSCLTTGTLTLLQLYPSHIAATRLSPLGCNMLQPLPTVRQFDG
jgi:hypothetical protein